MVLRLERKKLHRNGGGPFVPAPAGRVDRVLRLGVVVGGAARPAVVILRLVSQCDPWHRGAMALCRGVNGLLCVRIFFTGDFRGLGSLEGDCRGAGLSCCRGRLGWLWVGRPRLVVLGVLEAGPAVVGV